MGAASAASDSNQSNGRNTDLGGMATLADNTSAVNYVIITNPNSDFGDRLNASGTVMHDTDGMGNEQYNVSINITTNPTTSGETVTYNTAQAAFDSGNTEAYFQETQYVDFTNNTPSSMTLGPQQVDPFQYTTGPYTGFLTSDSNTGRVALHLTLFNGNETVGNFHVALPSLYDSTDGTRLAELGLGKEQPLQFGDFDTVEMTVNSSYVKAA